MKIVTRVAAVAALTIVACALAQRAAAQEYQLNQWHLSLANGQQATIERERGGSEWRANWVVPAPVAGESCAVSVTPLLRRRHPIEPQAFMNWGRSANDECEPYAVPSGLGLRPVVTALCVSPYGGSYMKAILEGARDGHQVGIRANLNREPFDHRPVDERWVTTVLSSMHLEETRRFDWTDVQCGAFHPAAHAGVPYPTFFCMWDGQNRLTADNCQPSEQGGEIGCDYGSYTEATFAEIGVGDAALTIHKLGENETRPPHALTLPGFRGRAVEFGVKSFWSTTPVSAVGVGRLVEFLKGARVDADPAAIPQPPVPWRWIALGCMLAGMGLFVLAWRARRAAPTSRR